MTYHRDPPPVIKRLHDASIQTASSSSASRSPIRMSSYRRQRSPSSEEDTHSNERTIGDDLYEPPVKRSTSSTRKTTTTTEKEQPILSTSSVKRTATGASVSSRTASSISTVVCHFISLIFIDLIFFSSHSPKNPHLHPQQELS